MRDFENYLNTDKESDKFYNNNNQNTDRHSDSHNYNNDNYNNASFYGSYNNNSYSSNSNYNNTFNSNYNNNSNGYSKNRAYHNTSYNGMNYNGTYNKNSDRFPEWFKQNEKKPKKSRALFLAILPLIMIFILLVARVIGFISPKLEDLCGKLFMILFFGSFTAIGLFSLLSKPIQNYRKKKRCKYFVKAIVVDLKRKVSHSSNGRKTLFLPQYEFCYRGKKYVVQESSARNFALPKIGAQIDMRINENDPYDFYVRSIPLDVFHMIFGLVFLSAGMYPIICFILM